MQYLYEIVADNPTFIPGVKHSSDGKRVVSNRVLENVKLKLVKTTEEEFSQEDLDSPTLPNSDENKAKTQQTVEDTSRVGEGK